MGKSSKAPDVPSAGENMRDTIEAYLDNQGQLRQMALTNALADVELMRQVSPQYASMLLGFEEQFGPQLRAAESEATAQTRAGDILNLADLGPAFQQAVSASADPRAEKIRNELGSQIFDELRQGTQMDAGLRREVEQGVRQAQGARGITRGTAPALTEAFTRGSRGLQLRQQRQQAADNFLRQTAATRPDATSFITGRQGVQQANPALAPQSSQMGFGQLFNATTQANNTNAQLAFNASQMNQGGGIGGALGGGLAGFGVAGPIGAGIGAIAGML